jgi:hypothetical protein
MSSGGLGHSEKEKVHPADDAQEIAAAVDRAGRVDEFKSTDLGLDTPESADVRVGKILVLPEHYVGVQP